MVTLAEYLEGLKAGQEAIYYAVGDSLERLKRLPVVTSALARGYDVLLGDSEVDEFALTMLREYEGVKPVASVGAEDAAAGAADDEEETTPELMMFPIKNISAEDVKLSSEEETAAAEQTAKDNERLFEAMVRALDGAVEKVVVSTRLTDAPVCITSEGPVSLEMEKVLSKLPGQNEEVKAGRVLEVNASHPVFKKLQDALAADRGEDLNRYTKVLYGQALLIEGMPLDDPIAYAQEICALL
jgi:molecular chaperone HtpG